MLQIISATVAAVVALLTGYMMWFPESGGPRPGAEFGSGLLWLTALLYVIGCLLWIAGLIGLFFARQRYQVVLQAVSALVYFYPLMELVRVSVRDRYVDVYVSGEYVVEWKVPAEWTSRTFDCEVSRVGGLSRCGVKQGRIQGNSLELSGGPIHVDRERQILRFQVWREDRTALDDYIFLVDFHDNKKAGEISDWIQPCSRKVRRR